MTPSRSRPVLLGLALALAALVAAQAPAVEGGSGTTQREEKRSEASRKSKKQLARERERQEAEREKYALQARTAEIFAEVREHLGRERYDRAEASLRKLRRVKLSPYERAQANRLRGYIAYGRQDHAAAVEHMLKALERDALPPADQADVLFQVAQIQGAEKRWRDVVATLSRWFAVVEQPNSVGYYLLALAHFQLENLEAALPAAQQAVALAETPQAAWLQLLLAVHLSRKDYAAATPVLLRLITSHSDVGKGYWLQLSALYGVNEENDRALATMELAYRKGILTDERDLIRLVQLNLLQGIPYRAATVLEKEMAARRISEGSESFELLSGAWILAREVSKAEAPLARAAELAPKGDLYVRLAQVHMMQEEWSEAAAALRLALAKGGLGDAANAELLLGIAYYNERQLAEARSWFARAQRSVATREQAQTWIEHIDRELGTRQSVATAS
jgi:tetratricopeptide (TPR) repeat protein